MYLNGSGLTVGINTAWSGTLTTGSELHIGRSYDTHNTAGLRYNQGNLKDLMMFTRALTVPEIKQIITLSQPITGRNDFYPTLNGIRGAL
jgi:hypothetical protein